jgi:hypothetical protein
MTSRILVVMLTIPVIVAANPIDLLWATIKRETACNGDSRGPAFKPVLYVGAVLVGAGCATYVAGLTGHWPGERTFRLRDEAAYQGETMIPRMVGSKP